MKHFHKMLVVPPGSRLKLGRLDPDATCGFGDKDKAAKLLTKNVERLAELQYRLYAENRRALLIVLQAMDAGGKDGTIRHVMSGMNPQGCRVTSFKAPSADELAHDFLWRIHKAVPAKGEIGVFNRSHYEDVLIVRVHNLVPESEWSERYDQINRFERILAENNVVIRKFFLHISKDEQRERLERRLKDKTRRWKVNPADFEERKLWHDYMDAYEAALSRCSTDHAPWFVIPANHKWVRNAAVSSILVETLEAMNLKLPRASRQLSRIRVV